MIMYAYIQRHEVYKFSLAIEYTARKVREYGLYAQVEAYNPRASDYTL